MSEKTTVLEEIELGLFTGFEDTTALEDKKSLTVFSAIAVVGCTYLSPYDAFAIFSNTKHINSPNDTTPSEADSAVPVSCSAFVRTLGRRVANALLA